MSAFKCPHCGQEIEGWRTITATIPDAATPVLDDAIEALRAEGFQFNRNRRVAMGQVLEVLAASYLAGEHDSVRALAESRADRLQDPTHDQRGHDRHGDH